MIKMVSFAALCFIAALLSMITAEAGADSCVRQYLTSKEGTLSSPGYPHIYPPNTCRIWTLKTPFQDVITVSFKTMSLPIISRRGCSDNYVEIGPPGKLRRLCGDKPQPYISAITDNEIIIKFVSGHFPTGVGFELSYSIGPQYSPACKDDQYRCKYGHCILASWRCNFQNECEDGSDEHYCNDFGFPSNEDDLVQNSTTEPTPQSLNTVSPLCRFFLRNPTGNLRLLQSTANAFKSCSWLIEVPGRVDKIVLRFSEINVFSDAHILVYGGRVVDSSTYIANLSGWSHNKTVTAYSSVALVVFRMSSNKPHDFITPVLFSAQYTAYGAASVDSFTGLPPTTPSLSDDCYHRLYYHIGNFTMPSGPFLHSSVRSCAWYIYQPFSESYIHLTVTNLYLRDGQTLEVYDGHSHQAPSLAVYSPESNSLPMPLSVRSSGRHMLVQFTSPSAQRHHSLDHWMVFRARYHFEDSCEMVGEHQCGAEDNMCYRPSQRCDGVWDCPLSGADEQGCYLCQDHSFSCEMVGGNQDAKCYDKNERCNGDSICPNGADENNCRKDLCSENLELFLCANQRCIQYGQICDGTDDCGDNTDEMDCRIGNSRKVVVAAVVGALLSSLILVLSLGCACKFYYLRHNHHHNHRQHRTPRYDTPLSRLQAEMFRRRAPPPPYHEAMITSRPYDEAVREYLAQTQQQTSAEQASGEQSVSGTTGSDNGDVTVQNLINLMDISQQSEEQGARFDNNNGHILSDSSSETDSDDDDDHRPVNLAEDDAGHIEMTENLSLANFRNREGGDREDISEDSVSAALSADGTEMTSVVDETATEQGKSEPEPGGVEGSDKDSDEDSVCILCLEDDPGAQDDGSDTTCLLQHV